MKKMFVVIIIFTFLSSVLVQGADLNIDKKPLQSVKAIPSTFLIGTVLQPVVTNTTVQAKAISIFYYNASILHSEMGVIGGLKEVEFIDGFLFFMFTPGPLEKIYYIYGFTSDFRVINE